MCNTTDKDALAQLLIGKGCVPISEADFEILRIESGLKRFGHELSLDYIPLEADLWHDVSFNKGCYVGQEIIARMESRGRLAKRLVRLRLAQPVQPGADITADGKKAGIITSAAVGPNGAVALGFVKTAVLDSQLSLTVGDTAVKSVEQPTAAD
jgi:folate-binding protein YgfZ